MLSWLEDSRKIGFAAIVSVIFSIPLIVIGIGGVLMFGARPLGVILLLVTIVNLLVSLGVLARRKDVGSNPLRLLVSLMIIFWLFVVIFLVLPTLDYLPEL